MVRSEPDALRRPRPELGPENQSPSAIDRGQALPSMPIRVRHTTQRFAKNDHLLLEQARETFMTPEDYLVWEQLQDRKHEYMDGQVIAMSGADKRHVLVSVNLVSCLRRHLAETPCEVFNATCRSM